MQVFIEIPYSEAVFEIIGTMTMAQDNFEDELMTDTEFDDFCHSYDKKMEWQFMEDAQSWVNKYIEPEAKVKSVFSTGNETIKIEIEV